MLSRRTFVALILCSAFVVGSWLIFKKPAQISIKTNQDNSVSVKDYIDVPEKTNDDWKKLLTNIDPQTEKVTNLTKAVINEEDFDDTTLTAQLARDVLSSYIITAKKGDINSENAGQVVNAILSSPQYTQTKGAVYLMSNLHIVKTDQISVAKYKETFNKTLVFRLNQTKNEEDPITALKEALYSEEENPVVKIDATISANKGFIVDLLRMDVPANAVELHLDVLNSSSDLLSDLEAMKQVANDPIRSMAGISQYSKHFDEFLVAMGSINKYFEKN